MSSGRDVILLTALAAALGASPNEAESIAKRMQEDLDYVGSPSQGYEFIERMRSEITSSQTRGGPA